MIYQYDSLEIGRKLRWIREKRKYSRKSISERSNISIESIRRMEKGLVLPQLQTLMDLSNYYNYDLLSLIASTLKKNGHNDLYNKSDHLFQSEYNIDADSIEGEIILVDLQEVERLNHYKFLLRSQNSVNSYNPINSMKELAKLIIDKHSNFCEDGILDLVLNVLDIKMLTTYASLLGDTRFYTRSLNVLEQLEAVVSNLDNEMLEIIKLHIKIKCLQSYNYHSLNEHQLVISTSTKGINFCKEKFSNYYLYYLFYRRAIAYFIIGDNRYKIDFQIVRCILESDDDYVTLDYLKRVTYKKYQINI